MQASCLAFRLLAASLAAALCGLAHAVPAPAFADPLDIAAQTLTGAQRSDRQPVLGTSRAGARLIAVGLRGLIVLSDDQGKSWRQARVPVQSDLTAVCFVDAQQGWAVGHEGVILHSSDGGQSWTKQLDGRQAATRLLPYYQKRVDAGEAALKPMLDELSLNTANGATLPFLGVYFESAQVGYAVGSFGMIVATEDGGRNWVPWLEHIDNPQFYNLNDIRAVGGSVYIAGEHGGVYRLDREHRQFAALPTAYRGSLFGITGDADYLLAYGLGGHIFRSDDAGSSWQPVASGTLATLTSAERDPAGQLIITSDNGQLLLSRDQGRSFVALAASTPDLLTTLLPLQDKQLLLGGLHGLSRQTLASGTP